LLLSGPLRLLGGHLRSIALRESAGGKESQAS